MWHKHHKTKLEKFSAADNDRIIDINIPAEQIEDWRRYLKKQGFDPLEVEAVVAKSTQRAYESDLQEQNLQIVKRLIEKRRGKELSEQESQELKSNLPHFNN